MCSPYIIVWKLVILFFIFLQKKQKKILKIGYYLEVRIITNDPQWHGCLFLCYIMLLFTRPDHDMRRIVQCRLRKAIPSIKCSCHAYPLSWFDTACPFHTKLSSTTINSKPFIVSLPLIPCSWCCLWLCMDQCVGS